MEKLTCGKCTHAGYEEMNGVSMLMCGHHKFPTHKSYNCGDFLAKPEVKKLPKIAFESVIDNFDAILEIFVGGKPTAIREINNDYLFVLKTINKESGRLYNMPVPRTVLELLWILGFIGIKYELVPDAYTLLNSSEEAATKEEIEEVLTEIGVPVVVDNAEVVDGHDVF
jgi:hypothetical protein